MSDTENQEENQEEIKIENRLERRYNQIKQIRQNKNVIATIHFSTNAFYGIGVACTVQFVYEKRNEIIVALFATSCGICAFFITLQLFQLYHIIKNSFSKIDEQDKITEFLEKEYEKFQHIYANPELKKTEYENENEMFLKELNKVDLHFHETLPFDYNKELILFYNHENESFDYYSANSDIHYKFLNSTCRSYVLKYHCVNLFQDEMDIKKVSSDEDEDEDYEKIEDSSESEQEEEYETKQTRNSVFYVKKTRQEKEKKKESAEKKINKFIYKGNMTDYYNDYLTDNNEEYKNMSYEDYKQLQAQEGEDEEEENQESSVSSDDL